MILRTFYKTSYIKASRLSFACSIDSEYPIYMLKSIFDSIINAGKKFVESSTIPANTFTYRIKCFNCSEIVTVRIFPDRDLNRTYDEYAGPAYTLRKEVMDPKCRRLMYLTVNFDRHKRQIDASIDGGEILEGE